MDNDNGVYDLALYPTQNVKTRVVAEPFGAFSDDRIHLRVDLEQGWYSSSPAIQPVHDLLGVQKII